VFVYFFYKMDKTVEVLQEKIEVKNRTSKQLHSLLDSIERELTFFNTDTMKRNITKNPVRSVKHAKSPQKVVVSRGNTVKEETKINVPVVSNPASMKEIRMYTYRCDGEIRVREYETVTHVECLLNIQFDENKMPIDSRADMSIQQRDDETNKVVKLAFKQISSQLNPDRSFRFLFREIPLPAANELDAQNHGCFQYT
jgi:hypothetical protein